MFSGHHLATCFSVLILTFVHIQTGLATKCEILSEVAGVGREYYLDRAPSLKVSVVGFEASVSYVTASADASPKLTITGASEEPTVSIEDGVLTISTAASCDAEASTNGSSSSSDSEGSSATFLLSGLLTMSFRNPRMGSFVLLASMLASMNGVYGDAHSCTPSLEIEISMPTGAQAREVFGETNHYLAATVETVTWGYYDPNATAQISMNSGETITVEVVSHHSGHDYAKMIRGDPAVEEIFYWAEGQALEDKPEPKLPGSGVHLVTGPIEVIGAEPGDIVQVDILELDPRLNPETGRCFGTNSQKFAGYHFRTQYKRDGTEYVRTGGTEAITVFEFLEDDDGKMIWGKPVYMYRFPNMTAPDGSIRTFDNNPSVVVPHEYNVGYNGELLEEEPIVYPEGFDATNVTDEGGIKYLSPDEAKLNWKVPLRPHLGVLAVMPNNTVKYIDEDAPGGANTIPPSRFGGNIDDWRIGKGGTMYYQVEIPGAMIVVGDTHAAQGDSELAGTAMETSMTTKLRVTLHKAGSLPAKVATLDFPLLETSEEYVVHGFAYSNYLDQLEDPSDIFAEGASLDLAMEDCFIKTRNWLMDVFGLIEEETIAMMTTAVDFGITQVVDGNWGVHADIDKFIFDESDTPYDYKCTPGKSARRLGRSLLPKEDQHHILKHHGLAFEDPENLADQLYARVTRKCDACANAVGHRMVASKMFNAKLKFAKKRMASHGFRF